MQEKIIKKIKQIDPNTLISNKKRIHQHGNTCNNSMLMINDNLNMITRNNSNHVNTNDNTSKQVVSDLKYMKIKATNVNTSVQNKSTQRIRHINGLNYNFNTYNALNNSSKLIQRNRNIRYTPMCCRESRCS